MSTLKAKKAILYKSRWYEPGTALPTSDAAMVAAWIAAGTAAYLEDAESKPKGRPAAAPAGIAGDAVNAETPISEVGKVPKTPTRTRRKKKSGE